MNGFVTIKWVKDYFLWYELLRAGRVRLSFVRRDAGAVGRGMYFTLKPVLEPISAEVLRRVDMQKESLIETAQTLRISHFEAKERLFSARLLLLKSLVAELPAQH